MGTERLDRLISDSSEMPGRAYSRILSITVGEAAMDSGAGDRAALKALWRHVLIGLALTVVLAAIIVLVST